MLRVWFKAQTLGDNSLRSMSPKMCQDAGIKGPNYTNHSVRKTGITKLLHENVPPTDIAQYSGHKNVASINNYATISTEQRKNISHILQHAKPSNQLALPAKKARSEIEYHTGNQQQQLALTQSTSNTANMSTESTEVQQLTQSQSTTGNPFAPGSPVAFSIERTCKSTKSLSNAISGIFAGASISGGTFNLTFQSPAATHTAKCSCKDCGTTQ